MVRDLTVSHRNSYESVQRMVDTVQDITIAFDYSSKREQFFKETILEQANAVEDLGKKKKLVMLSDTRWTARSGAFTTVKKGICPLVTTLEKLDEEEDDDRADGFLQAILQFEFLIALVVCEAVLKEIS